MVECYLIYYYGHCEIEGAKIKSFENKELVEAFVKKEKLVSGDYCILKGEQLEILANFDNRELGEMLKDKEIL